MNSLRIAAAALIGVSMMGLTACGEDETTTTPTAGATTTAAAAGATAEATTAAAAAAPSDKEICEAADKAGKSFKDALVTMMKTTGGADIPAADAKLMLTDFANNLTKAAEGAEGKVATAVKANAALALKGAEAKDPVNAVDTPESAKASKELNAACKAAGVTTTL